MKGHTWWRHRDSRTKPWYPTQHQPQGMGAALNPHFMLVNYTGAAGDLPGEIPRKIGPRGRKIRPWPWSEKLHFVMPGSLRMFGSSPAGLAQHFWEATIVASGRARRLSSWYTFALPDFLPFSHPSRTREL